GNGAGESRNSQILGNLPLQSRHQRRQRAQARQRSERDFGSVPHSFVFARGRPGRSLRSLCRDLRRVLEPFTTRNLQV
ncbi:SSF1 protein, partial [Orthonyx spaldingii]|nr:SSF1 protein [Orthonyx spaldingii]